MNPKDVPPTTPPIGGSGQKISAGNIWLIAISIIILMVVLGFSINEGNKKKARADEAHRATTQQNVEQTAQVAAESIQEVAEQRQEAEPEPEPDPDKLTLSAVTPNCKVYSFWQDNRYVYVIEGKDCHIAK